MIITTIWASMTSIAINKTISYICSTLLGLIFLFSAFAKAWDGEAFADLLMLYGPKWFSIGAPVLVFIESILGSMLLFRIKLRWSACAGVIFLIVVSLIYAYGLLFKGITECGCFGIFSNLYSGKTWLTFVRNLILVCLAILVILSQTYHESYLWLKTTVVMLVTASACFICGLSMRKSFMLPKISSFKTENRTTTMEKLKDLYNFSADSTYFVYLFSFTCPFCQNSFANVQQFEQFNTVDKTIGIAVENEQNKQRFYRIYHPEIDIITISQEKMNQITSQIPIGMVIEGNAIKNMETGYITSPGIYIK
jgi:hypothetical protein